MASARRRWFSIWAAMWPSGCRKRTARVWCKAAARTNRRTPNGASTGRQWSIGGFASCARNKIMYHGRSGLAQSTYPQAARLWVWFTHKRAACGYVRLCQLNRQKVGGSGNGHGTIVGCASGIVARVRRPVEDLLSDCLEAHDCYGKINPKRARLYPQAALGSNEYG